MQLQEALRAEQLQLLAKTVPEIASHPRSADDALPGQNFIDLLHVYLMMSVPAGHGNL